MSSTAPPLAVLYRGPLASCNYACSYCAFSPRRTATAAELRADEAALARFCGWVARQRRPLALFFTPRGEALVHGWYQRALLELCALPHLHRVAIQTNLSTPLGWLRGDIDGLGLWATFHPERTSIAPFVRRCQRALDAGARLSVGAVGRPAAIAAIEALRAALPPTVYLWINIDRRAQLDASSRARLQRIDPLLDLALTPHPSRGRLCRAGERSIAVSGDGTVRRCHFVDEPLGRLYDGTPVERLLRPRPCPAESCRCHIGYVNLAHLELDRVFGDGILERIPARPIWRAGAIQASDGARPTC